MGIIPLFVWGEANALFFFGKIYFIKKAESRIKVFETSDDSTRNSSFINAILISFVCVFKQSIKSVMKGSLVESIEEAQNEFKKTIRGRVGKTYKFN